MKPDPIDELLARAADRSTSPDAVRESVRLAENSILADLRPVRPLRPGWFQWLFFVTFAALAWIAGAILGLHGIHALSTLQSSLIFPALLFSAAVAAAACVRAMRPSAGAPLAGLSLLMAAAGFPLLFSALLHSYTTRHFAQEGVPCLVAGLCVALPTGLLMTWILRRGFVLSWSRAGLAAGTLAGLTGLAMLELHCPNLKAIHVIVWHVAVVVTSACLGWAIGRMADRFVHRRPLSR